jgi:translation initiation factor 4B
LTFEVEESEVRDFFGPGATTSVRLVKDLSGKPKGFGYAEFKTQQDLKDALDKNMTNMSGRTIRVSVADSRMSKV